MEELEQTPEYARNGETSPPPDARQAHSASAAVERADGAAQTPESERSEQNADDIRAPESETDNAADTENSEIGENAQAETESGKAGEDPNDPKARKKSRVMRILRNVLLVAAIALGIIALVGIVGEIDPNAGATIGEVVRGADPVFCVVLVIVVLSAILLDVAKFCIVSKTVTGKVRFGTSVKVNFVGKYYDAVTPFAAGGQPMQIYYLNTKGISGGNSSAMVLIRYIFSILSWIILGGILMIIGTVQGVLDGVSGGNILRITGWIGIGINLIIPTFVLLFLVLPKFMTKLTRGVVKLGSKMKIVKDVDKATTRAMKTVNDFKSAFKHMATSPVKFILLILTCFGESALTFSVPYFVMKAFSCPVDGMALAAISLNVFAIFGVSFIPTPGNAGVMESMSALAFSVAAGPMLIWSVLTWRFSVFYIYIIIGLIMTVCDIIRKNMRRKKAVEKRE